MVLEVHQNATSTTSASVTHNVFAETSLKQTDNNDDNLQQKQQKQGQRITFKVITLGTERDKHFLPT